MAMNKRERSIAMAMGVVVGILILDYALIEPLFAAREDMIKQIADANKDYSDAVKLIARQPILEQQFQDQKNEGLPLDASRAQEVMTTRLHEWGDLTGVEVTGVSPSNSAAAIPKLGGKPNEKDKSFMKLTCSASIKGRMQQIGQFLYQIQTSQIPMRVSDMTFEPEKEGQDGLKISLKVSSIFLSETGTASRTNAAPASTRPNLVGGTTRPGAATRSGTLAANSNTTRPATNAAPVAGSAPIMANPGNLSVEDQMKLRRQQQSQPQATATATPASAPATQPETH